MRASTVAQFFVLITFGCSSDDTPDPGGGGASSGAGGALMSSGGAGAAGTATGGTGGSGVLPTGGHAGSAGTVSTGGAGAGGGGGGTTGGGAGGGGAASGGTAGSGTAGSGGMSGGAGGGGGGNAPNPSSGCGKAGSAVGSAGSPLTAANHQYYVKLPSQYNASKAYPLLFVFHPTGNPIDWAEKNAGYEKNGAKDAAIRVYPASASNSSGWVASDVSFFAPLYDKVTADYCVDRARVFATGESSGGDFSSILGCEHADKLRAVAPCATKDVPQYPLNASTRKCSGQVAAIVIHGKNDNVVGPANGPKTRDFYAALNHCGMQTTPVPGYTDTLSNCVQYQGCDAPYPVYWCQHTDPNYSNTNHGWPAFAGNMTWETFSKY
jgi:polyhydroxybutyrate depolymerase